MSTATPSKPPASTANTSTSAPPSTTPFSNDRERYLHHAAVAGLVICPAVILLPPRKFDFYTVGLLAGTLVSANHLTYHYSGRSFATRWSERLNSFAVTDPLPPKAKLMQERLKREREERDQKLQEQLKIARLGGNEGSPIVKEIESKLQRSREGKEKTMLQKVWYGQEGEDWKQKRDEREKKALAEGRGYGDLIMDQIWEVWNWGQTSDKEKGDDKREKEDGKK